LTFIGTSFLSSGAKVVAVLCIVDRLQGARELLTPQYELRPIFTIEDFGGTNR